MSRTYPLVFYNLDNNRPQHDTDYEIRSLLTMRPAILGLCETTDQSLPDVDDYRKIRDTSKPGRDNVAAYVKTNLDVSDVKWLDCQETWTRTAEGASGQHWPRSICEFRAGRLQVWIAHQPPKGTDNVHDSQQEGIDRLSDRMAPWRRDDWSEKTDEQKQDAKDQIRVVLWDANRKRDEDGPGPGMLGSRIDGWTAGDRIDCATLRGNDVVKTQNARYFGNANGCVLQSDHGHAFAVDLVAVDG